MSNAANVSTVKPKIGGAVWRAPVGTKLPTTADEALNAAFKGLGYISTDGITNGMARESAPVKAWGGDVVASNDSGMTDTFKWNLLEILNEEVLKVVYGDKNVTGTLSTGLTVKANNEPQGQASYVIDMILKNGVLKRVVIPRGTVTAVEDVTYNDSDPVGYNTTITAEADETLGGTHVEYIKAGAAAAAAAISETWDGQQPVHDPDEEEQPATEVVIADAPLDEDAPAPQQEPETDVEEETPAAEEADDE